MTADPSVRPPAAVVEVPETPGIVAPPPLIYLGGLAVGIGLDMLLRSASLPAAVRWGAGIGLLLIGLALMASFLRAFRRARTAVDPYKPSSAIVSDGPFRLTRNPGYLGMAFVFCGIALLAEALWALAALVPALVIVDRGVIAREERYLERRFGDEYTSYKARVRRWL